MIIKIPDRTDLNTLAQRHKVNYKTLKKAFLEGIAAVRGQARERCRQAVADWEKTAAADQRVAKFQRPQNGRAA